jgi:hypothetical protein
MLTPKCPLSDGLHLEPGVERRPRRGWWLPVTRTVLETAHGQGRDPKAQEVAGDKDWRPTPIRPPQQHQDPQQIRLGSSWPPGFSGHISLASGSFAYALAAVCEPLNLWVRQAQPLSHGIPIGLEGIDMTKPAPPSAVIDRERAATDARTSQPAGDRPWAAHGGGWAPRAWWDSRCCSSPLPGPASIPGRRHHPG